MPKVKLGKTKKKSKSHIPMQTILYNQTQKQYEVTITYSYLLKAPSSQQAIHMAMDRLLGRNFKDVYFNGMTTDAIETAKIPPTFDHISATPLNPRIASDYDDFKNFQPKVTKGAEHYGISIDGNRTDTKEQEYIHFDPTDTV